jgi:hypothetical protein
MNEGEEKKNLDIEKSLKDIDESMGQFASILEKFGMDLITKIGKINTTIKMLIDKVDKLDKATLDVKGLKPKLNNIIENQNSLDSELELLKSLMQKSTTKASINHIPAGNKEEESGPKSIIQQFNDLESNLDAQDALSIRSELERIKENIFEESGGNKILYDISQVIKELKNISTLSDEYRAQIKQKIKIWKDKA